MSEASQQSKQTEGRRLNGRGRSRRNGLSELEPEAPAEARARKDRPYWDEARGILWYEEHLVKWVEEAPSQAALLKECEDQQWTPRIDYRRLLEKQVPRKAGESQERLAQRRSDWLHNALKGINAQRGKVRLRFRRNRSKKELIWYKVKLPG